MAGPVSPIQATSTESDPFTSILNAFTQLSPTFLGTGATNSSDNQTSTTGVSPQVAQTLQSLLGTTTSDVAAGKYSKEAAINDSQGQIQQIIKDGLQKNMPSVASGAHAAGLYNASTTDLLSNDLQSRLAAQAAAAVQQNIASYANIQNQATKAASDAAKTIGTTTNTSNTGTKQTQPVIAPTKAIAAGGSVAAAAALANKLGLLGKGKSLAGSAVNALGSKVKPIDAAANEGYAGGTGAQDSGVGMSANYDDPNSPTSEFTSTIDDSGNQTLSPFVASDGGGGGDDFSSLDFSNSGGGEAMDALSSASDFSNLGDSFGSAADLLGQSGSDVLGGIGTDFLTSGGADAASGLADGSEAAGDIGSGIGDAAGGLWDSLSGAASDAWDSAGDFFGGLFADGGRVPTKEQVNAAGRIITAHVQTHDYTPPAAADKGVALPGNKGKPQRAFADGGAVIPSSNAGRQSPSTIYDPNALNQPGPALSGALSQVAPTAPALITPVITAPTKNIAPGAKTPISSTNQQNTAIRPTRPAGNTSGDLSAGANATTRSGAQEANGSGDGTAGNADANAGGRANVTGVLGGMVSAALGLMSGNPIGLGMGLANAVSNAVTGHSVLGNVAISLLNSDDPVVAAVTPSLPSAASPGDGNASGNGNGSSTGAVGSVGISGEGISVGDTAAGSAGGSSSGGLGSADSSSTGMGADAEGGVSGNDSGEGVGSGNAGGIGGSDGAADGGPGGDSSGGDSSGGDGGSAGGDGGSGGGDGGGDGGGYKNGGDAGGKMAGHDTKGKDKIKIKVSGGEYIMPTDVVDHLGVDFFDRLKDMYHHPIAK